MSDILEVHDTTHDFISPEFPMVLFLRGDEDYFNDFCMNAEQVMQVLGIRRSRLNQISGKELRVGRARIDNYVRPVYRKQDVEEYLKWIRPTATHKKSSDMLNEARTKLEEQSERISDILSSRFESLIGTFTQNFENQFSDQKHFTKNMLVFMQKNLRISLRTLLQRSSFLQSQSLAYWEDVKLNFEDVSKISKELEQVKAATVQISDRTLYCERMLVEMQSHQKQMAEKLDSLVVGMEELKNPPVSPSLPIQRFRRGSGVYSRGRQAKESPDVSESQFNKQSFLPAWRRKKVSMRSRH